MFFSEYLKNFFSYKNDYKYFVCNNNNNIKAIISYNNNIKENYTFCF